MNNSTTTARVGGTSRRSRRGSGVATVLTLLASMTAITLLGPAPAGAQLGPCSGAPGTCSPDGEYEQHLTFTGDATCTWTIDIDWGDGSNEQQVFRTTGNQDVFFAHTYSAPGIYRVQVTGSGVNAGTGDCTFENFVRDVEVPPPGSILCLGRLATVKGTAAGEELFGTPRDDVIVGRDGDDIIHGRGGSDRICAGRGDDVVLAGAGVDGVEGGTGRDVIRGGSGLDVLAGGAGNDRIFGSGGVDLLLGGAGRDLLDGGRKGDVMRGHSGNDRLRGRGGPDIMNGGADIDSCIGGAGQDTVAKCEG